MAKTSKRSDKSPIVAEQKNQLSRRSSLLIGLGLVGVIVVSSLLVANFTMRVKENISQADTVVTKVKKILLVPVNVQPTVIEVSDPARLKSTNPDFYADVATGDYLLMYPSKAIIYRQSTDQIINVAPIRAEDEQ